MSFTTVNFTVIQPTLWKITSLQTPILSEMVAGVLALTLRYKKRKRLDFGSLCFQPLLLVLCVIQLRVRQGTLIKGGTFRKPTSIFALEVSLYTF